MLLKSHEETEKDELGLKDVGHHVVLGTAGSGKSNRYQELYGSMGEWKHGHGGFL